MQEDAPSYKLYNFCNDIPSNIGDKKLYITRKPMYVKAGSDVEHVTRNMESFFRRI